ncbi:hypothetical protein E2C01_087055 [Portunus trituberculatus]|uniref:Uncharacterized protein n=1 Tax=Portunus trituberculatus TaxID=210409 RepID=A0A5B7JF48_PORTR|nr:hypothetical protein [Portunus trituberculatus]
MIFESKRCPNFAARYEPRLCLHAIPQLLILTSDASRLTKLPQFPLFPPENYVKAPKQRGHSSLSNSISICRTTFGEAACQKVSGTRNNGRRVEFFIKPRRDREEKRG